jgi:hypothetical protein
MTSTPRPPPAANSCAALGQLSMAGAAAPWALNLAAIGEAAAATATDYKALVCVFLYGGNDYGNTLVPYDSTSWKLQRIRGDAGHPAATLAATLLKPALALPGGLQYALAPELAPLQAVFDSGRLAVLLNVGTLIQPTTQGAVQRASRALAAQAVLAQRPAERMAIVVARRLDLGLGRPHRRPVRSRQRQGHLHLRQRQRQRGLPERHQTAVQYQVSSNGSVACAG